MLGNNDIDEKMIKIPIKNNLLKKINETSPKAEYGLKMHSFDPTKSSPPNDFLLKLKMRIDIYNSSYKIDNNDYNFEN